MAIIVDETFDTGIPGAFATARASGGTFAQTYNAAQKAVDLSPSAYEYGMWDLTSVALAVTGEVEVDIETISTATGAHALGVWLVDGSTPAVTNGILAGYSNGSGVTYMGGWTGGTAWAGNSPSVTNNTFRPFAAMAERHTLNVRWDMGSPSAKSRAELRVDGSLILVAPPPNNFVSLRPSVFTYSGAVRLHSIKVWDAPRAPMSDLGCSLLPRAVGFLGLGSPQARLPGGPATFLRSGVVGIRNTYFGGNGRVQGTVKESKSPSNVPLRRRVQLIDESTRMLVREVWSDGGTGAYDFNDVDANAKFTVITYDHLHNYRAVIADNITPELMP